ncbi:MAG: tetratricopeptide repeat protein [Clostridia bacterium]|nr:tetratricopeptide repeat protein [Clostridia bacterium]
MWREAGLAWATSVSLENVGGIYEAQNQPWKALECYREVLSMRKKLKNRYRKDPQYRRDYSVSLSKIGDIYETQDQPRKALRYYEEDLVISREFKRPVSGKPGLSVGLFDRP